MSAQVQNPNPSAPSDVVARVYDSVMLDLETMGLGPNATPIQIGAVMFNSEEGYTSPSTFKADIDLHSALLLGGEVDNETVLWWRARGGLKMNSTVSIANGLRQLAEFLGRYPEIKRVWAQGPSFDIAVLEGFYRRAKLTIPWKYNAARDTRTVYDLARQMGWEKPKQDVEHVAVADCLAQIKTLMSALEVIRGKQQPVA